MMNKNFFIVSLFILFGLGVAIYQYTLEFKSEFANAYSSSRPANGHSWTEMECTEGLCVTADNKVGVGTDSPTTKFEVNGVIKGTDVCNTTGNCLSALASLTNACGGAATNYASTATTYTGTYCVMGTPTPTSPSFPAAGGSTTWTCPVTNGSPIACTATREAPIEYLIGGIHTTIQCGNVFNTGSGKLCVMSGSSCPTGWTQYQSYSSTSSVTIAAGSGHCYSNASPCSWSSCTTGSHSFSNTGRESCSLVDGCASCAYGCCYEAYPGSGPFYATITSVGCY